jgi:hypothetical protein
VWREREITDQRRDFRVEESWSGTGGGREAGGWHPVAASAGPPSAARPFLYLDDGAGAARLSPRCVSSFTCPPPTYLSRLTCARRDQRPACSAPPPTPATQLGLGVETGKRQRKCNGAGVYYVPAPC